MSAHKNISNKNTIRLLKLLAKFRPQGLQFEISEDIYFILTQTQSYKFNSSDISKALRQSHMLKYNDNLKITDLGLAALKLALEPDLGSPGLQMKLKHEVVKTETGNSKVLKNINESPLGRLYVRKNKRGEPYLSGAEFQAGERLRQDFEKGQLQPKISASLQGSVGSTSHGAGNSSADISDFAIDARSRLNKAVDAIGPELSGITIDICCFLKGLEIVERERRWPPRSAKLMLKTALSILARHYGIIGSNEHRSQQIRTWHGEAYRPAIT